MDIKSQVIKEKDGKIYVENLKVLLAKNFNESQNYNDKLSTSLNIKEGPVGWYCSEKFDGIRAIWDGEKFISRSGKVYTYVPKFFIELMPKNICLDGEIWINRGEFNKTNRLSTLKIGRSYNQDQLDSLWLGTSNEDSVKYMVYDLPNSNKPFEERMKELENIIEKQKKLWLSIFSDNGTSKKNIVSCPLILTKQILINNMEQFYTIYKNLTGIGAEGVMLRAPNSPYENKRSKYLLKYKISDDREAIVLEYLSGTGKYKNLLGSLRCELLDAKGKKTGTIFNIGTGFNDAQRMEYNDVDSEYYIPIGTKINFGMMELSKDGVPRHPVYRGVRDY